MKIVSVNGVIPNKVGIKYASRRGYDTEGDQVKIEQDNTIVFMSKTGKETLSKRNATQEKLPQYKKFIVLEGNVYSVEEEALDGEIYTTEAHESQIPKELLPQEVAVEKVIAKEELVKEEVPIAKEIVK